ncbi:hypothetical protein [Janthinobacterium sp. PAMC25594]|uniref:hypothetical protein n=1 Tax=Janthinobacterium sp. PAMC25594 TaxID=2861284 RepID=UPI001C637B31|nr:hypothetical protein [Janthinobacterium sp. PAMC25594]QYG08485.1 hypothetical protein KY494_06810 [Janthinobacterium sp. PAMC25594]
MQLLRQVKLSRRLALLVAIFSLGLIVYGGWSLRVLHELKVNGPVYQRIVQGKDLVADVLPPPEYILESYLVERRQALKAEYDTRHQFWRAQDIDRDIAEALLTQAHAPAMAFYEAAFTRFIPALRGPDKVAVATAMAARMSFGMAFRGRCRAMARGPLPWLACRTSPGCLCRRKTLPDS